MAKYLSFYLKSKTMLTIDITIQGVTPLMMNRFDDDAAMASEGSSSAFSGTSNKGTPREQAERKIHFASDKKTVVVNEDALRACITAAGSFFKAGQKKITTSRESLIPACVTLNGLHFALVSKEPWSVDSRRIVNPATKGARICHRPIWHQWKLPFSLTLDDKIINERLFREILDTAGQKVGLLEYRPARKGPFGKFVVTQWSSKRVKDVSFEVATA